jgi:hypothetical protein
MCKSRIKWTDIVSKDYIEYQFGKADFDRDLSMALGGYFGIQEVVVDMQKDCLKIIQYIQENNIKTKVKEGIAYNYIFSVKNASGDIFNISNKFPLNVGSWYQKSNCTNIKFIGKFADRNFSRSISIEI